MGLLDSLKNMFSKAKDTVEDLDTDKLKDAAGKAKDMAGDAAEKAKDVAGDVVDKVRGDDGGGDSGGGGGGAAG